MNTNKKNVTKNSKQRKKNKESNNAPTECEIIDQEKIDELSKPSSSSMFDYGKEVPGVTWIDDSDDEFCDSSTAPWNEENASNDAMHRCPLLIRQRDDQPAWQVWSWVRDDCASIKDERLLSQLRDFSGKVRVGLQEEAQSVDAFVRSVRELRDSKRYDRVALLQADTFCVKIGRLRNRRLSMRVRLKDLLAEHELFHPLTSLVRESGNQSEQKQQHVKSGTTAAIPVRPKSLSKRLRNVFTPVLPLLDAPSLARLSAVCTALRHVCISDRLWRMFVRQQYPTAKKLDDVPYHHLYVSIRRGEVRRARRVNERCEVLSRLNRIWSARHAAGHVHDRVIAVIGPHHNQKLAFLNHVLRFGDCVAKPTAHSSCHVVVTPPNVSCPSDEAELFQVQAPLVHVCMIGSECMLAQSKLAFPVHTLLYVCDNTPANVFTCRHQVWLHRIRAVLDTSVLRNVAVLCTFWKEDGLDFLMMAEEFASPLWGEANIHAFIQQINVHSGEGVPELFSFLSNNN